MSREVVIVAYGRSAVCKSRKGSFAGTHPIEYSAQVLKGVLDKVPQLDRSEIEDVIMGCAVQHGTTSMNIAKSVCARAELPECVAGHTINRFCSSGLQAIATGANAIACGQGDVIVAGGVESMTDTYAPYPVEFQDAWLNEHAPGAYMGMGMTAENIVKNYGVTREEMDRMAYESNMKAAKAQKEGKLAPSIIPVTVVDKDGNEKVVTEDEGIRPTTTMETLAGLKPCFIPAEEGGTVTRQSRRDRARQKERRGERTVFKPRQQIARSAPDQPAGDHRGDQRDVDAARPFGQDAVKQPGHRAVGRQLERHGDRRGEHRRHAEERGAQQRGDKAHNRAHRAAAYEACKQNRQVHRTQHCADLRDMPGEDRQY